MPSKLHKAIQDATKVSKNTTGPNSNYGKGWNAAMEKVARILNTFEDDGTAESQIRYEFAIRNQDGSVHRVTVARGIAEMELAKQLEEDPQNKAELVARRVVSQLHSDWVIPPEAGSY